VQSCRSAGGTGVFVGGADAIAAENRKDSALKLYRVRTHKYHKTTAVPVLLQI